MLGNLTRDINWTNFNETQVKLIKYVNLTSLFTLYTIPYHTIPSITTGRRSWGKLGNTGKYRKAGKQAEKAGKAPGGAGKKLGNAECAGSAAEREGLRELERTRTHLKPEWKWN